MPLVCHKKQAENLLVQPWKAGESTCGPRTAGKQWAL